MKCIAFIIIFCSPALLIAQDPQLRSQIVNYQDSTQKLIENSRLMISKELDDRNYEKVADILNLLNEEVDYEKHVALTGFENILIPIIIGSYENTLIVASKWDSISNQENYSYLRVRDNLTGDLLRIAKRDREDIERAIKSSFLDQEQKDLVTLLFHSLISIDETNQIEQETLNSRVEDFLSTHPETVYASFVKKVIREKYVLDDWGYGMFFGAGWGDFQGGFSEFVSINAPVYISLEAYYRRYVLGFRIQGGGGEVQQACEYKGVWPNDLSVNPLYFGATLGYSAIDHKIIRLQPYLELGGITTTPIESERNGQTNDLSVGSFVYGGGIALDIFPLNWDKNWNRTRLGIRIQGGILKHQLANKDERFDGDFPHFGVGLFFDLFDKKRDNR